MEKFCEVVLVTFFDDVIVMTPLKWLHSCFISAILL